MSKSPNITTAPTGQIAPFGLRMLPDLREQIEAAAKASGRSMNAEIVARLQGSFEARQMDLAKGEIDATLKTLTMALVYAERLAKRLELANDSNKARK